VDFANPRSGNDFLAGCAARSLHVLGVRRPLPNAFFAALDRKPRGHRTAELEAILRGIHAFQRRDLHRRLSRVSAATAPPAQPGQQGDDSADHNLSHRNLLLNQHESTALFGRGASFVFQPAVLHLLEADTFAGDRPVCLARRHSRFARRWPFCSWPVAFP